MKSNSDPNARDTHLKESTMPASQTNRLINEKSPYLQQHATNPVNWYPWGPEALTKARSENKPILLSIRHTMDFGIERTPQL